MEINLEILYEVHKFIEAANLEHPSEYLDEASRLLDEVISEIEWSSIANIDDDDESFIPTNN